MNIAGSFLWSGLNLASVNFLYDAVSPPKRHTCGQRLVQVIGFFSVKPEVEFGDARRPRKRKPVA